MAYNEEEHCYLTPLKEFAEAGTLKWLDNNQLWVQQYPFDSWSHPLFSDTTIDVERATKLKESFDHGVRGQRIFADYEHGRDPAKGNKAAGDVKELKVVTDPRGVFTQPGLWARVQFTDTARQEIESGEWNYWSTSHWDTWTHPQTGKTHEMVYGGGGLTNSPYVKGMAPLNFSEVGLTEEQVKEFAVWDTAYMNDLPDSAFLYVEPGGKKDSSGKTTPRSLRHFPVKDSSGAIDLAHVRNAIARAPQASSVPASVRTSVQNKARAMLNAKSHNEQLELLEREPIVADETVVVDPPVEETTEIEETPVVDETTNDENEGGDTDVELEKQLRIKLGLSDDADIVKAVGDLSDEVQPIRDALKENSERKAFSEQFPEEYKRMVSLEASEQERKAKTFSESFAKSRIQAKQGDESVDTTLGFTALVLDELQGVAKKFGENTATLDDVKDLMDKVVAGGIIDYGTKGSSREDDSDNGSKEFNEEAAAGGTIQEVRKAFAERVAEIVREDEVDYNTALNLAATKYPVLAEAYRGRNPVAQ